MTRISVELIPRDRNHIINDMKQVKECFPIADSINIPDLMRFSLRSWNAFQITSSYYTRSIPHIRAIDINPDLPLPGHDINNLQEILVIQGDPPSDFNKHTYPNSTESILRRYRRELPNLKLYAAFDPYRRSPKEELEHVLSKKEAGASGFFTQPIFDEKMLELCMDWLHNKTVFWGLSPVIGPKSKSYWEITNKVVFPHNFETSLQANIDFAKKALQMIKKTNQNAYLMPLRVKLTTYLSPLQEIFQN